METGILYLAVINQFLNQEHNVEETFMNLLSSKDWWEVRRIPLPVKLKEAISLISLNEFIKDDGKVNMIYLSKEKLHYVNIQFSALINGSDSSISEHFRMLDVFVKRAFNHADDSRKHRTFLVTMFQKA